MIIRQTNKKTNSLIIGIMTEKASDQEKERKDEETDRKIVRKTP